MFQLVIIGNIADETPMKKIGIAMTAGKHVAQSPNFDSQPPVGSQPGGGRAHSAEVGRALAGTILRTWDDRIPSRTVVSGAWSDLECIPSLLAGEPSLQSSSGKSPLVAIELPQGPISAQTFLKQLCERLPGKAPIGSHTDILRHAQNRMRHHGVSTIAISGLGEALAGQKPKAIERFFESILPPLRPYGSGQAINIVITCSPEHMEMFAASNALSDRWALKQIEIYELTPDAGDLTDFIAIGPNVWGKGKTLQQAREIMESVDDHEVDEYEIWLVHESCEVNELGDLCYDKGHSRPQKLYEVSCGR